MIRALYMTWQLERAAGMARIRISAVLARSASSHSKHRFARRASNVHLSSSSIGAHIFFLVTSSRSTAARSRAASSRAVTAARRRARRAAATRRIVYARTRRRINAWLSIMKQKAKRQVVAHSAPRSRTRGIAVVISATISRYFNINAHAWFVSAVADGVGHRR